MGRLVWEKAAPRISLPASRNRERDLMQTLSESFGQAPEWPPQAVQVSKSHIATLRALATAKEEPVFDQIADLVAEHGAIRVWPWG